MSVGFNPANTAPRYNKPAFGNKGVLIPRLQAIAEAFKNAGHPVNEGNLAKFFEEGIKMAKRDPKLPQGPEGQLVFLEQEVKGPRVKLAALVINQKKYN